MHIYHLSRPGIYVCADHNGCLVLAFASDLRRRLPGAKGDPNAAAALLAEVQRQVQTLERYADKPNHGLHGDEDLETEGTSLWNLCTRLNRESSTESQGSSRLVLASRVLAYQILHLCQWSFKCQARIACHLMAIALKAAKVCTSAYCFHECRRIRNSVHH